MLFGDGFWASAADAGARSRRSASCRDSTSFARLPPTAGFRIERDEVSTLGRVGRLRGGLAARASRHRRAPEAVAFAAQRRREYEDGYRGAIGFGWLVLAPGERLQPLAGSPGFRPRQRHSTGSTGSFAATTLRPSRS